MTDPKHHTKRIVVISRILVWRRFIGRTIQQFHPVVQLPKDYDVRDFTQGNGEQQRPPTTSMYDIGRYNEVRPGMYTTDLFQSKNVQAQAQPRNIHVGMDIGAPIGTACMAFVPIVRLRNMGIMRPRVIMGTS